MIKKTLILALFSCLIFIAPRATNVSSASDCTWNPQQYAGISCGIVTNPYNDHDADDGYQNYPSANPIPTQNSVVFKLTSNNNLCVGSIPSYAITNGPANATVNWASSGPSGNSQTSFNLDASGNFSGSGNTWQSTDVGHWTKTAIINGVSQSLNFTVTNCGNNSLIYPNNQNPNSNTNNYSGNSANTYYNPYNNNILQPLGGTNNNYQASGNTYYNPYTDNIFQPLGGSSTSNNQNYQAPGNTYYNPFTNDVPCIDTKC